MIKEEKPIFLKIFSIILIILVTEAMFIYIAYINKFPIPELLIIVQAPLILFLLGFTYMQNRRIYKRKVDEKSINIEEFTKDSKTDLDALYKMIIAKKRLSVKSVSHLFQIEEDLAMEWARILESGDLVTIEYPGFSSPSIVFKEKNEEETFSRNSLIENIERGKINQEKMPEEKQKEIIGQSQSKKVIAKVHKKQVSIKKVKKHTIKKKSYIKTKNKRNKKR